jgi:L-ascorbate metabolism protein UlaG (beta-lactamase superfamily)
MRIGEADNGRLGLDHFHRSRRRPADRAGLRRRARAGYDIPERYPGIDLGLIHAGGTTLFVTVVTMTGPQAVRAVEITRPRTAIPIHYNDYSLFLSGLDDFKQAAAAPSADTQFRYLTQGERYQFESAALAGAGHGRPGTARAG